MFTVADYIETLLYSNNCVIVPGLGSFTYSYCPAAIAGEAILPPGNKIVFNPSVVQNDGLLIRTIIKERKIGYQEAARLIDADIRLLDEQLKTEGSAVSFGSLGSFCKTGSTIQFEETPNVRFNADYFGLVPVTLKQIDRTTVERRAVQPELENKGEDSIRISISKLLLRRAVAAAAIIILLMLISQPISHTKSHTDYAQLVFSEMFDLEAMQLRMIPAQEPVLKNTDSTAAINHETSNQTVTKTIPDPVAVAEPATGQKKYAVIIASLPSKESALNQLEVFKKKGYTQLEIIERDGNCRIAYAVCASSNEAYRIVEQLTSGQTIFKDAWVLPVKR